MQPDTVGRKIALWDIPRILRDELGMTVLDLNTTTLGSREPRHPDRFRKATEDAGCVITNLKVNEPGLPFEHHAPAQRRPAMAEYKLWIAAAARLGARWLRPMPAIQRPTFSILVESYRGRPRHHHDCGKFPVARVGSRNNSATRPRPRRPDRRLAGFRELDD